MIRYITQLSSQHPLGFRLLTAILLCSSLMTLLATGSQLYFDYRYELSAIDERIRDIEASSLDSLSTSLWAINPEQVQVQLERPAWLHYLRPIVSGWRWSNLKKTQQV